MPYAVAIGSTAIALLLRLWLEPWLLRSIGAFFYIAIIVSVWYGGFRPGFVAVVLSTLAINYFLIPPRYQFGIEPPKDVIELGTFLLVAFLINLLTSNFRDSKQKIERLSQQLAQENAEQLRMALSAAQMGMWYWNIVTGEINWSSEHEQLFGLSPGTFDGKYETFDACLHPDDREKLNQAIERSLKQRVPYQHEYRVVWADGSIHWIEARGQAFYDEAGQPVHMTGTVMLLDERKQAQIDLQQLNAELEQRVQERTAELAQANDRLLETVIEQQHTQLALQQYLEEIEDLYNNAPCGYHSLDPEGNIIQINDTELNWLGYSRDEVLHKKFSDFVTAEGKQVFQDNFPRFKQQGWINNLEFEIVRKDGTTRWLGLSATGIKDEVGNFLMSRSTLFDITDRKRAEDERKQAEAALQESEERRRLALDLTHIGFWDMHLPSGKLIWNDNLFTLQGLAPHSIEPSYELCRSLVHPDDVGWIEQRFLESMKNHTDYVVEYRVVYPDGSVHWVMGRGKAIYDESGQPVRSLGVVLDISDRKRAEQMLELQAVITRNMAEGICLVRADNGVIVYANPKFEQMFGYDCGELNGQHVSIVNYASEQVTAEEVNQAIRSAVLQSGDFTYEVHNVKKDGTPFWCSATCSVFSHPDYGDVLVAVHQDITVAKHLEEVRKRTEEELRQSEAKFRSLSESSPLGIFMTDIGGQCIYTNPRYQAICGCTFDEALGDGWVQFIHPEDREPVATGWSSAVSQRQEFRSEIRYARKDRTIRFGRVHSAPIFSVSDELIGYVGTVEDITDSRAIETMKNEFISIVSHELRTPLTSIRGSLGLVAAGVFKNKPEAAQQMLDIAAHDTERLVRLVNDILDLERLDAHKVNLVKQWCDAETLLQQSVKTVQSLAAEGKITLRVEADSIQVWVDCDRIIQTLVNLVSNAIKFSPPESTITLSVQDQADRVLFQVKDQGRGIPADKLDTIFGRFQQVDASDSRQKGGTGLGLAICKSIVQQHGGKIWVESVVGEGSNFYFTVPKSLD